LILAAEEAFRQSATSISIRDQRSGRLAHGARQVKKGDASIFNQRSQPQYAGMGTTLVMGLIL
jgi:hypothetical protein